MSQKLEWNQPKGLLSRIHHDVVGRVPRHGGIQSQERLEMYFALRYAIWVPWRNGQSRMSLRKSTTTWKADGHDVVIKLRPLTKVKPSPLHNEQVTTTRLRNRVNGY